MCSEAGTRVDIGVSTDDEHETHGGRSVQLGAALILAGVAAAWAQGPASEGPNSPGREAGVGGPSFVGSVTGSLPDQPDLAARREHCSVDPDRLRAIGREVGQQVRVEREGVGAVLFTVGEARDESPEDVVRAGKMGRARFGPASEFPARVFARVPHPTLSDAEARRLGEFVERADDDGVATGLLVLAPHGGDIELHTDAQAERLAAPSGGGRQAAGHDLAVQGLRPPGRALRLLALAHHVDRHPRGELSPARPGRPPPVRLCCLVPRHDPRGRPHRRWRAGSL